MNVLQIPLNKLKISDLNVRNILTSEEDETTINDLAADIKKNGLINPITIRKSGSDNFEIIAGQRRFMACKSINMESISCSIIDVADQQAEEISLVENVQRNQMTNIDKIKSYSKLYDVYKDINKVAKTIHISKPTLQRYLKLNILPDTILQKLDSKNEKITLDVAVSLTKLPQHTNYSDILSIVENLPSKQQIKAIKDFSLMKTDDLDMLGVIVEDIVFIQNNINPVPLVPYVIEEDGNIVIIPENLYPAILKLIKTNNKAVLNNQDNNNNCHIQKVQFEDDDCTFCGVTNCYCGFINDPI